MNSYMVFDFIVLTSRHATTATPTDDPVIFALVGTLTIPVR